MVWEFLNNKTNEIEKINEIVNVNCHSDTAYSGTSIQ